ncbi:transcription factor bHLH96-like isoform X2 [Herrania umbratica]|uniref:Transcription factor bHLH96-like isoform X2 n=1 Tax=Herrania umbratica TaxID=108875 RepID=A0A6J0ZJE3_9ROSI|nr:transcription factor bHLH96-like isoform X2 [Herrania umbratica]
MALEAVVFQQDPFSFGSKDFYSSGGSGSGPCSYNFGFQQEEEKAYGTEETLAKSRGVDFSATWGSSPSLMVQHQPLKEWDSNSSSPDNGFLSCGFSPAEPPAGAMSCRRKRRRTKSVKNKEDIENQRMTHIAVERNRRRQMNDYLAVLKSMMPASYVQRYSTGSTSTHRSCAAATSGQSMAEKRSSSVADVEVTMVESHANLKILSKRHPKQLLKMVAGLHSLGLYVLHLNVTSVEHMVLYSLSVKVEDNCQLTTVNEIAAAVYEMVDRFQEEAAA